jgi:hypothetical protein
LRRAAGAVYPPFLVAINLYQRFPSGVFPKSYSEYHKFSSLQAWKIMLQSSQAVNLSQRTLSVFGMLEAILQ